MMEGKRLTQAMSTGQTVTWWKGFHNLLRRESAEWWGTRRWLKQAALWIVICNAFPALIMFGWPLIAGLANEGGQAPVLDPIEGGVSLFFLAATSALSIGITLIAQGQIIDEKMQGTAEWILSKPIARSAFLLAKIASTLFAALVLMIALPGLVIYGLLFALTGSAYPPGAFLAAEALVLINAFFYLALTFLLGVMSNNRGFVIGLVVAMVFGSQLLLELFPVLSFYTPWGLVLFTRMLAMGAPLMAEMALPVIISLLVSFGLIGAAIVIFERVEF